MICHSHTILTLKAGLHVDKEIVLKQFIDFSKYIKSDVDFQLLSITVKSVMYFQDTFNYFQ